MLRPKHPWNLCCALKPPKQGAQTPFKTRVFRLPAKTPGLFITRYLANAIMDCGEIDPNENFQGCRFRPLDIPKQFCHRMVPFAGPKKIRVKPGALAAEKIQGQIYNPEIPQTPMSQCHHPVRWQLKYFRIPGEMFQVHEHIFQMGGSTTN